MAKNKVKLNDKSDNKNKKKNNKLKNEKYISDDAREMRRFVIILFSVIIAIVSMTIIAITSRIINVVNFIFTCSFFSIFLTFPHFHNLYFTLYLYHKIKKI